MKAVMSRSGVPPPATTLCVDAVASSSTAMAATTIAKSRRARQRGANPATASMSKGACGSTPQSRSKIKRSAFIGTAAPRTSPTSPVR
jgi:hypothetical protein